MSLFRSGGPAGLLLPYHHTVSNNKLEHISNLYQFKNIETFSKDLDFLLKYYKPIAPPDLWHSVQSNTPVPPGRFLLTFDDGFKEISEVVAPLLSKKGVPAIFFINPAFIDNKKMFYRGKISILIGMLRDNPQRYIPTFSSLLSVAPILETVVAALKKITQLNASLLDTIASEINYSFEDYLLRQRPFLTQEQLLSLHTQGFSIGSHSMDHPYYNLLPAAEQVRQTLDSCSYVKELLNTDTCHFSFPHSDADVTQETIDLIREGNKGLIFGVQNQKKEPTNHILHRFNAERPDPGIDALIKGQITLNWVQQLAGTNTVKRNGQIK